MSNKKKKRNKAHNPIKPRVRLISWESDRSTAKSRFVTAQEKRGFAWVDIDGVKSFEAVNKPRNWTLIVRAIEWHQSGDVDIYPAVAHFRGVTLKTLEEEAKLMRKKALQKCDESRVVDVGWMAVTYNDKPNINDYTDVVALGAITEERQMLWNIAWREEVREIVEAA